MKCQTRRWAHPINQEPFASLWDRMTCDGDTLAPGPALHLRQSCLPARGYSQSPLEFSGENDMQPEADVSLPHV